MIEAAVSDPGGVDLWHVDLARGDWSDARRTLSRGERRRDKRCLNAERAEQFVRARAALRQILARYLEANPAQLRFRNGANGKPSLVGGAKRGRLEFNVSHSGALGLIAVCWGRRVGVDVQKIRSDVALDDVVRQFFAPTEVAHLSALSSAARRECFFRWWTRKEALVKARGGSVDLGLETPVAEALASSGGWSRCDLDLPSGWLGALVVKGDPCAIRQHQFDAELGPIAS